MRAAITGWFCQGASGYNCTVLYYSTPEVGLVFYVKVTYIIDTIMYNRPMHVYCYSFPF